MIEKLTLPDGKTVAMWFDARDLAWTVELEANADACKHVWGWRESEKTERLITGVAVRLFGDTATCRYLRLHGACEITRVGSVQLLWTPLWRAAEPLSLGQHIGSGEIGNVYLHVPAGLPNAVTVAIGVRGLRLENAK